ncbi:thrombospondin [Capsaspora owczarzaki ATCC 30864]|uniref:Thrombospondin n=1 Tax=Capsaspora owczarzaki (strain ATCC 30864) TaxID=595528 RepID=A0A0D2X394_CAPO3|nr:thrombospondin [Capsaspora owczarzaki ATCC 30864]KJE93914.1 thrombospondin [Capsaspora owczarzaki ATCC 30864]|eukprot:XP_004347379.1 thrombospondin [Capsaspora owczarzaki ATCC 30864]
MLVRKSTTRMTAALVLLAVGSSLAVLQAAASRTTSTDYFSTPQLSKIYAVTRASVRANDANLEADHRRQVWDAVEPQHTSLRRRQTTVQDADELEHWNPERPFPDHIEVSFTAADGSAETVQAELVYGFFADTARVFTTSTVNGVQVIEQHRPVLRAYHGQTLTGHLVSVVLHDEPDSFQMVVFDPAGHYTIEPAIRHLPDVESQTQRRALQDATMATGLILFHGVDDVQETLSDAVLKDEDNARRADGAKSRSPIPLAKSIRLPSGNQRRVAQWTNCLPASVTTTQAINVGYAIDAGYYQFMGSSTTNVQYSVVEIMSSTNMLYKAQLNVVIRTSTLDIRTTTNSDTWNQIPSTPGSQSCGLTINQALTSFQTWRQAKPATETNGLYHLLTYCYPSPGTVGLATVGCLCNRRYGGVSSTSSQTWITVAHEMGHNFNAQHTFDVGGLMDYGDGTYLGEYQFHPNNKAEVCSHMTASRAANYAGTYTVPSCWSNYQAICGNGNIEPGEDCDDTSACCSNCKFANPSYECSGGPCCTSCMFVMPNTLCMSSKGQCMNGRCVNLAGGCESYSNVKMCPTSPVTTSNQCALNCKYSSSSSCTPASSIGGIVTTLFLPLGTVCSRSPYSTCQTSGSSVACLAATIYTWNTGSWSACSPSCGAGTQTRTVTCVNGASTTVSDSLCTGTKPATSQSCNNGACGSYAWQQSGFGACSVPCGSGTQTQTVQCVNTASGNAVVADSFCTGTKPSTSQSCSSTACGWYTGSFGACSPSCGAGTQTRTVECRTNAGNGVAASSTYCTGTQPATSQSCNNGACPAYAWQQSGFGACSVPCGSGTQTQTVQCVNTAASNAVVADSLCTGTKPSTSQSCSSTACGWFTGSFGACSPSCGVGTQTRTVECRTNAGNGVAASSTYCTGTQPATSQSCNNGACPVYSWQQSGFGACSVPCGSGTQTQTVQCVNTAASNAVVADSLCTGTKPSTSQSCSSTACGWFTGSFGACSPSCGAGTQTRTVECRTNAGNGVAASSTYCTDTQPAASQSCNNGACGSYVWQQSGFGACSVPCGSGTQTQTVQCVNTAASNAVVADSLCTGTKPSTSQSCSSTACGWFTGSFGACSPSCGAGTQTRTVECRTNAGNGVAASSTYCTGTQPATSQSCNNGACPVYAWKQSGFGACSVPCGSGTQTQTVQCVNTAAGDAIVSDSLCTGTKPSASQSCSSTVCGWYAGTFGVCSVTCSGTGTQTRTVECRTNGGNGATVADTYCSGTQPASSQSCNNGACPTYAWQQSGFGACSPSCGAGTQTQTVQCVNTAAANAVVSDSLCTGTKPSTSQACNNGVCPSYSWQQSGFGGCTQPCGGGTQSQTVQCVNTAAGNAVVADSLCTGTKPATSQSCNTGACPSYSWQQSGFGACSASCGTGTQTQTVQCVNTASGNTVVADSLCSGTKPASSRNCNTHVCPPAIDCSCTAWSVFAPCSVSCGSGVQKSYRTCTEARDGGRTCAQLGLTSTVRQQACNTQACPVDCSCGAWTGPTACSATCGGGKQTYTRTCTEASAGGLTCAAMGLKTTRQVTCNSGSCPTPANRDCSCSAWSSWSTCSRNCGTGAQFRTRTCSAAVGSGQTCAALGLTSTSEYRSCNSFVCALPTKYMVALFSFDGSGPSFTDSQGNVFSWSSALTRRDTSTTVPAIRGNAAEFGGSASMALTSGPRLYEVTLSAFIQPSAMASGTAFIRAPNAGTTNFFVSFRTNGGRVTPFVNVGSTTLAATLSSSIPTTSWSHIAVTLNADGALTVYLNGTQVAARTGATIPTTSIAPGNWEVACFDAETNCYSGAMDELSVWNAALSAEEVAELYNRYFSGLSSTSDRGSPAPASGSDGGSSIVPVIVGVLIGLLVVLIIVIVLVRRHRRNANYNHVKKMARRNSVDSNDSLGRDKTAGSLDTQTPALITNARANKHQSLATMAVTANPLLSAPAAAAPAPAKKPGRLGQMTFGRRSAASNAAAAGAADNAVEQPEVGALFRAQYAYQPHQSDELELAIGDVIHVTSQSDDGWMLGKNNRTKKHGVCPGNYLVRMDANDTTAIPTGTLSVAAAKAAEAASSSPAKAPKPAKLPRPTVSETANPVFSHTNNDTPSPKPTPPAKPSTLPPKLGSNYNRLGSSDSLLDSPTSPPSKPAPLAPASAAPSKPAPLAPASAAPSKPAPIAAKPSPIAPKPAPIASKPTPPAGKPTPPPGKPLPVDKPTPPAGKPAPPAGKPAPPPGKPSKPSASQSEL